ncbi:MAG: hypothetical protein JWM90_146 [Thermoleophilia bacterium]|nr:hypothetical protein [Thermoleophilia bacterium]
MPDASPYSYPADLAQFVLDRWGDDPPSSEVLQRLYATCYQASQLTEESRQVTFRAILADPATFPASGGPPQHVHKLEFERPIPFDPRELRRLSAAADFARSIIGVSANPMGHLSIWGLVHQGSRWMHDVVGGRGGGPTLPHVPVTHVLAPGSIEALCGSEVLGRLEAGAISGARFDVFESHWLHESFQPLQDELNRLHTLAREQAEAAGERWALPAPDLARIIGEQMMKRIISLIRRDRHGGTLIFMPDDASSALESNNRYLEIKYRFTDTVARQRFFDLILEILNRLAPVHGDLGTDHVTWTAFRSTVDRELATLDEALFELANCIAGLSAVDGAVVLDKQLEIIGFGAVISGRLPSVPIVAHASDPEGGSVVPEPAANEGTRHRSAYRLVGALPGAMAIVVSQDGGARFITSRDGRVTYWDHE